jgi:diguanylate cyclase (GGDEF)-like protein
VIVREYQAAGVVGRGGGEAFTILLLRTPFKGAEAVAGQIRTTVESLKIRQPHGTKLKGRITVSLGIAVAALNGGLEDLMRGADEALYRAGFASSGSLEAATGVAFAAYISILVPIN